MQEDEFSHTFSTSASYKALDEIAPGTLSVMADTRVLKLGPRQGSAEVVYLELVWGSFLIRL